MELNTFLFYVLAILTGACAVSVVITQNIVRAAAFLVFTLAGTAGIFFLLGADFVGATQLLVYVGGTLVLVVFGVMLTAQGPFITMKAGAAEWAVATVVGVLLYAVIGFAVLTRPAPDRPTLAEQFPPAGAELSGSGDTNNAERLGAAFMNDPTATPAKPLTGFPRDTEPPKRQRMGYLLPFEIVSVHLLVVLLGAAYLARAKRRRGEAA